MCEEKLKISLIRFKRENNKIIEGKMISDSSENTAIVVKRSAFS